MAKKISGDEDAAGITSLVPDVKFEAPKWSWIRLVVMGLPHAQRVAFKLIPTDHAQAR